MARLLVWTSDLSFARSDCNKRYKAWSSTWCVGWCQCYHWFGEKSQKKQPQLLAYALKCRSKLFVRRFFNVKYGEIFQHISGNLSPKHHYTALMMPLMIHPTNQNAIICANLSHDPCIFEDSFGKLQHRNFNCNAARTENIDSPPLLSVHLNRFPMVATPWLIDSQIARRLNIDLDKCRATWHSLKTVDLQG